MCIGPSLTEVSLRKEGSDWLSGIAPFGLPISVTYVVQLSDVNDGKSINSRGDSIDNRFYKREGDRTEISKYRKIPRQENTFRPQDQAPPLPHSTIAWRMSIFVIDHLINEYYTRLVQQLDGIIDWILDVLSVMTQLSLRNLRNSRMSTFPKHIHVLNVENKNILHENICNWRKLLSKI